MTGLPLIGRDRVLVEKLAKQIHRKGTLGHAITKLWVANDRRGFVFEVLIKDSAGHETGLVAKVRVSLDRVEEARLS